LDVEQIQPRLCDDGLMDPLALRSRTITPGGNGAFIKAVGLDNGLHGASKRQQGDDNYNQIRWGAQSLEQGAAPSAEGLPTGATPIALSFPAMDTNVPLPPLSSCRTRQIGAKLG